MHFDVGGPRSGTVLQQRRHSAHGVAPMRPGLLEADGNNVDGGSRPGSCGGAPFIPMPSEAMIPPPPNAPIDDRSQGDKSGSSAFFYLKTKMCKFYQHGACTRGSFCLFAHSEEDLNPKSYYKTRFCRRMILDGRCENMAKCGYAHSADELRSVVSEGGDDEAPLSPTSANAQDFSRPPGPALGGPCPRPPAWHGAEDFQQMPHQGRVHWAPDQQFVQHAQPPPVQQHHQQQQPFVPQLDVLGQQANMQPMHQVHGQPNPWPNVQQKQYRDKETYLDGLLQQILQLESDEQLSLLERFLNSLHPEARRLMLIWQVDILQAEEQKNQISSLRSKVQHQLQQAQQQQPMPTMPQQNFAQMFRAQPQQMQQQQQPTQPFQQPQQPPQHNFSQQQQPQHPQQAQQLQQQHLQQQQPPQQQQQQPQVQQQMPLSGHGQRQMQSPEGSLAGGGGGRGGCACGSGGSSGSSSAAASRPSTLDPAPAERAVRKQLELRQNLDKKGMGIDPVVSYTLGLLGLNPRGSGDAQAGGSGGDSQPMQFRNRSGYQHHSSLSIVSEHPEESTPSQRDTLRPQATGFTADSTSPHNGVDKSIGSESSTGGNAGLFENSSQDIAPPPGMDVSSFSRSMQSLSKIPGGTKGFSAMQTSSGAFTRPAAEEDLRGLPRDGMGLSVKNTFLDIPSQAHPGAHRMVNTVDVLPSVTMQSMMSRTDDSLPPHVSEVRETGDEDVREVMHRRLDEAVMQMCSVDTFENLPPVTTAQQLEALVARSHGTPLASPTGYQQQGTSPKQDGMTQEADINFSPEVSVDTTFFDVQQNQR